MKGEIGGLENYVRHVVRGLSDAQAVLGEPLTIFARRTEVENVRELAPHARILTIPHETAEASSAAEIGVGGYDVLFCPLLILEPSSPPIPSAVMVPDLLHEFHPEFFTPEILEWRHQHYGPTVANADIVFTLSEDAKLSIVERHGIAAEKVVVVSLDVDPEFRAAPNAEQRRAFESLRLPAEYLYYPANYWPHKNHENLLRAMSQLAEGYPSLHLVLTGARATGEDRVREMVASMGLEEKVRILGYQDRSVLPEIYRNARALVFPSLFEGFGIPILEAFHCRTPVVTSGSGSCPEIAGAGALVVDASDPSALAGAISETLGDPDLRDSLIAKGQDRAGMFSWENAVELTLESLRRVAPDRPARSVVVEDRPVVTIVTPTYNMAKYLEETIESVLSQDYPHIDYLVMDGASTDGTQEILRKYQDKLRFRSEPDGGQADAVNKGFLDSRGRVFAFLNADDTYLEGAVGKAVTHLVANPGAAAVYGEGLHVFENGEVMARYPTQSFSTSTLSRNCYICQPTTFLWADIFESAGMLDTSVIAIDYDLWIRLAQKGYSFAKLDDDLATSRLYPDNKTLRDRGAVYRDIIGILKRHYGYVSYDWLFGYACFLADGKDQVFEATSSSFGKVLLSLALGARYNPMHFARYFGDWVGGIGLAPSYPGRWPDGWISKRYSERHTVGDQCRTIRISGRHLAPQGALDLTIRLDGETLGAEHVPDNGPFAFEYPCPERLRGGVRVLEIESASTFQPRDTGDMRHLACIVDSIEFVPAGA